MNYGLFGWRATRFHMSGMEQVVINLNKQINLIQDRSLKGLIKAVAHIRRETETTPPLTPLDLGNLRSSWFVVTSKGSVQSGEEQMMDKTFKGRRASQIQQSYQEAVMEAQGLAMQNESGGKKFVIFGYGANYAAAVHEMIGAEFQREGSGPKWFEKAINSNIPKIVNIVKDNTQV